MALALQIQLAFHQTASFGSFGNIGSGKLPEILAVFNGGKVAIKCGNIDTALAVLAILLVLAILSVLAVRYS